MNDTTQTPGESPVQPLTCSVEELADMLGCSESFAESLVAGDFPPPGMYVMGPRAKKRRRYRVVVPKVADWIELMGQRQREESE